MTPEIESAIAEIITCRRSHRRAEERVKELHEQLAEAHNVRDEIQQQSYKRHAALMELLTAEAEK